MRPLQTTATALCLSASLLAPALAPAHTAARASRTQVVAIHNIAFSPSNIQIRRGDRVSWRFLDGPIDTEHNVTSYGRARFASSQSMKSGTYTVRFTRAGTYLFHCTIHPNMQGRIRVR